MAETLVLRNNPLVQELKQRKVSDEKPVRDDELVLQKLEHMPGHLQFNPYITEGYRPIMTPCQCVFSIFSFHNETINILTHGFAIIYFLFTIPNLPWSRYGLLSNFLSWCHLIGAVSPWVGSFLYHVFMNVNHDHNIYKQLLKLDMLGIWLCQSFGGVPMVAVTGHCLPSPIWHFCISTYCVLSVWGLLMAMNAKSPWQRRLCFLPPFLMRMFVLTLRCCGIGGGSNKILIHLVLQDLLAVIGGVIGALRVPEKWIPGKINMMLNSHNIMHVMVVLAVYSMHLATVEDLAWMFDPSNCIATDYASPNHVEL